jgi:hypothetical protein
MKQRRSRYLRTVGELTEIVAELREIKDRPIAPPPNVAGTEQKLLAFIDSMLPHGVDAGTGHVFDDFIDATLDEWVAAGYRHHSAAMTDLNILSAQVEAHLAGHNEMSSSDRVRVHNSDLALQNAMLRMADDDRANPNPFRGGPVSPVASAQGVPPGVKG